MTRVRVAGFSLSIDGFGAGPAQSLEQPLGKGGEALHQWAFGTRTFKQLHGGSNDGNTGVDDQFMLRSMENVGAWILGRNMFGPIRGPWLDSTWQGWWGEETPYKVPVYVLTHHAREPITFADGTSFHFVTGGIHAALDSAQQAAAGKDVRIGGGVDTLRQYLGESLIDELHLVISPIVLGEGENLFSGINLAVHGYHCTEMVPGEKASHLIIKHQRLLD